MTVNDERNAGFRASLGSALFFEIVCCRWAGTNEIENRSLILRHPKMTNTLWLGEKTACRPRFQFALVEFLADAVIERAAQHHYVSVIGMRMGHEGGVRRPPDQLDVQSGLLAIPHDGRKFLRGTDAENSRPRHLVEFYRGNGQLAAPCAVIDAAGSSGELTVGVVLKLRDQLEHRHFAVGRRSAQHCRQGHQEVAGGSSCHW